MSAKKWLADRYINRIVHRTPKAQDLTGHYIICDSWEEAYAATVELREAALRKAESDYQRARHHLSKAKNMQRRPAQPDGGSHA